MGAAVDAEVEDAGDVPVMQERGQARFPEKHFDELRLVNEGRQDALEANALLEPTRAASDRQERLRHTADTESLA
jgi:hypothetical protein